MILYEKYAEKNLNSYTVFFRLPDGQAAGYVELQRAVIRRNHTSPNWNIDGGLCFEIGMVVGPVDESVLNLVRAEPHMVKGDLIEFESATLLFPVRED